MRARALLANVALSLGATVAFLALLEGGARLVERRRPPRPQVADYIWDWDEKMPGGFYVMKSDGAGWPPWEEFNGDGVRDRTRPREKPDLVRRIAVLGDSVTLGDGLRPDQAYPQRLEARFAEEGRPVEVMSVSLWGWSTRQERIAWTRIARGYRPDQAVLAVCLNDIPELFNNLSRPPRWLAALHARSALARLVVNAEGREIDSVERLFTEAGSARVEKAMRGFFDEVRALRAETERDGARLSLVVFPFRFQGQPGAPRPVVQERIAEFCRAEGLRCVDLRPALAPLGGHLRQQHAVGQAGRHGHRQRALQLQLEAQGARLRLGAAAAVAAVRRHGRALVARIAAELAAELKTFHTLSPRPRYRTAAP